MRNNMRNKMNLKEIIEIFENTKNTKIFEIPNTLPEDKKEIYSYAKLCPKNPIISIIGPYSAGKSSFINTLCKKDILPTHTSQTTSIPTFISKGNNKIRRLLNIFHLYFKISNFKKEG
jgi:predicted GTPase